MPMTPDTVRAVRALLRENTTTFGERFKVSGRTVEDWEQGRRKPRGMTLDAVDALIAQHKRRAVVYK